MNHRLRHFYVAAQGGAVIKRDAKLPGYFVWGLNRSWATGLPPRPAEQKAAKTFEQKAPIAIKLPDTPRRSEARLARSLGSTTYADVLQA
jgi:hypothetical protein